MLLSTEYVQHGSSLSLTFRLAEDCLFNNDHRVGPEDPGFPGFQINLPRFFRGEVMGMNGSFSEDMSFIEITGE